MKGPCRIEIVVHDLASAALDAVVETLDRVMGWPVDDEQIDRWADDGGREP